jgi:hypothetical protein
VDYLLQLSAHAAVAIGPEGQHVQIEAKFRSKPQVLLQLALVF